MPDSDGEVVGKDKSNLSKCSSVPKNGFQSSKEILTELFTSLNMDLPDFVCNSKTRNSDESTDSDSSDKTEIKHKKRKRESNKSDTDNSASSDDREKSRKSKKKKHKHKESKHKHKHKHKHRKKSSKSKKSKKYTDNSDSNSNDEGVENRKGTSDKLDFTSAQNVTISNSGSKQNCDTTSGKLGQNAGPLEVPKVKHNASAPSTKSSGRVGEESRAADKSVGPQGSSKPKQDISAVFNSKEDTETKVKPKIIIKDLKNSAVYEATIKEIEEKTKHIEEGELTPSSSSGSSDSEKLSDDERKSGRERSRSRRRKHRRKHKSRHDRSSRSRSRHRRSSHHRSSSRSYRRSYGLESRYWPRGRKRRRPSPPFGWSKYGPPSRYGAHRSRSRSSERSSKERFDREKLLEIARKKALSMLKKGELPITETVKESVALIKSGGTTVTELTNFCKKLSEKGEDADSSSDSESDDPIKTFINKNIHHPFSVNQKPSSIVMNIKNAVPLPTRNAKENTGMMGKQLRLQYPVSSGQEHKESESSNRTSGDAQQTPMIPTEITTLSEGDVNPYTVGSRKTQSSASSIPAPVEPAPCSVAPTDYTVPVPPPLPNPLVSDSTLHNGSSLPQTTPVSTQETDFKLTVAQRIDAIMKMTEARRALSQPHTTAEWRPPNSELFGQFTGSTGARILTPAELQAGYQPWVHKDQFKSAKPVSGGFGMNMLQKMGWKPGEGLGKNKQGPVTPFEIDIKVNRRGLTSKPDYQQKLEQCITRQIKPAFQTDKHPVSLLNEFCSRKKFPPPTYDCSETTGAGNKKLFAYAVTAFGKTYKPTVPAANKKLAKLEAATLCLQAMGLLPTTSVRCPNEL